MIEKVDECDGRDPGGGSHREPVDFIEQVEFSCLCEALLTLLLKISLLVPSVTSLLQLQSHYCLI